MYRYLSFMLFFVHSLLLLQFYLISRNTHIATEWVMQFLLLFVFLLIVVFVNVFINKKIVCMLALSLSVVIVSIIAVPFRLSIGVNLTLFLILFLEGSLYRRISILVIPSVVFALTLIFIPRPITVWEMKIVDASSEGIIISLAISGVIIGLIGKLISVNVKNSQYMDRLRRMKNAVEELSAANLGYSTFAQFAQHQATMGERNRITREIHDGIGYTLTNIMMLSEASLDKTTADQKGLHENIDAIRIQAKTGLYDARRALRLLRSKEKELPRGVNTIRQMIDIYSKATGTEVNFQITVPYEMVEHPAIFLTIYRFVQEALTNSFRHGHATEVNVNFCTSDQWIIIIVRDNGIGTDSIKEGIGLQGMRERIEFVGGALDCYFANNMETGFTVSARVPIQGDIDED